MGCCWPWSLGWRSMAWHGPRPLLHPASASPPSICRSRPVGACLHGWQRHRLCRLLPLCRPPRGEGLAWRWRSPPLSASTPGGCRCAPPCRPCMACGLASRRPTPPAFGCIAPWPPWIFCLCAGGWSPASRPLLRPARVCPVPAMDLEIWWMACSRLVPVKLPALGSGWGHRLRSASCLKAQPQLRRPLKTRTGLSGIKRVPSPRGVPRQAWS